MYNTRSHRQTVSFPAGLASVFTQAARLLRRLLVKGTKRQQTREMLDMSDALLSDIGLTRGDVIEAASSGRDPEEVLSQRRCERLNRNGRMEAVYRQRRTQEEFGNRIRFLSGALTGKHWPN